MLTLEEVKGWLNKTDDIRDDELEGLMNRAIEAVQREFDWYFGPARATAEVLNGTGTQKMFLRQPPVGDVTVYYREGPTAAWIELESALFENEGRGIYHDTCWTRGYRNYRFEYNEGFPDPPGDVVQLTLDLIASKWGQPQNRAGVTSETLGRYSYTLGDLKNAPNWTDVAANWRRKRI